MLESIQNRSSLRNLILMILSSFAVVMVMAMLTQTLVYEVYADVTMPDTRFSYSFDDITNAFDALGQEGLYIWAQAHLLDFLFPLTYMFSLAFGINIELRNSYPDNMRAKLLVLFPLFGGIMDYVENILVLTQIVSYPILSEFVIVIASAITSLKWILLGAGFVIVFVLIPVVLYRKRLEK